MLKSFETDPSSGIGSTTTFSRKNKMCMSRFHQRYVSMYDSMYSVLTIKYGESLTV